MMYPAYIALIVIFILVIVLQAWFVRRLSNLHDQAQGAKSEYNRLRSEMMELSETVGELSRGRDSNEITLKTLEREIEDAKVKIRDFLEEHEELRGQFGTEGEEMGEGSSAADEAPQEEEVSQETDPQEASVTTPVSDDA